MVVDVELSDAPVSINSFDMLRFVGGLNGKGCG